MATVNSTTIFDEGRAAKAAGKPDSANPYEAGSQESLDWLEGYTADEAGSASTGRGEAV